MPRGHTVKVGNDWVDGMLVGRSAAIAEWSMRKEIDDAEFELLCKRLRWRKWQKERWVKLPPEKKAEIYAYRKKWKEENYEQYREVVNKAKCAWRKRKARAYVQSLKKKREKYAREEHQELRERVHTCAECGVQWCYSGLFRLPPRPAKYCRQSCRSRANHKRGKAAGKSWAKRDKASRRDRRKK
jgi:hypothetical protein